MALPSPVPPDLAEFIASRMRLMGDPNRIRILDLLRSGELPVGEIAERLEMSQQNASKHLGILAEAGVVERRKVGTSSYYAVADRTVFAICEQVCGGLERQIEALEALAAPAR